MMMLSVAKQSDEDMRTIGELFYVMVGEGGRYDVPASHDDFTRGDAS